MKLPCDVYQRTTVCDLGHLCGLECLIVKWVSQREIEPEIAEHTIENYLDTSKDGF